jgi:hypothetical protein
MDKIKISNLDESHNVNEVGKIIYDPNKGIFYRTCDICGGDHHPIAATGVIIEGDADDWVEEILVCSFCMDVGGFDASLEDHIKDLESRIEWLRGLIGKLEVMPDDQAWRDACKARTTENRRRYLLRLKEEHGIDIPDLIETEASE